MNAFILYLLLNISFLPNSFLPGKFLEAISLNPDPVKWLSFLKAGDRSPYCSERAAINFGHNIRSTCLLLVPKVKIQTDCDEVKDFILEELLGPILGETDELRVASYGDSSVYRPVEWVPIVRSKGTTLTNELQGKY